MDLFLLRGLISYVARVIVLGSKNISSKESIMSSELLERPLKKHLPTEAVTSPHFEKIPVKGYEQVIRVTDQSAKLDAIIAIHNTTLGPALGGVRIYPYANVQAALDDVLRLSKGMTYKAAIAEVGFGGGKSVIIADPQKTKTPELLRAFGRAVEKLAGSYICAEDMGCTTEDVKIIRQTTKYVVGLPHVKSSGDPGPFTAWGVFRGIQSVVKRLYKSDSLEGCKIAVQGLGNVGGNLVEHLFWAGADLILSDLDAARLERYAKKYRAKTVSAAEVLRVECDVLAPCAMGGVFNDATIALLRCKAIAGAANNQLLSDVHADVLKEKGVLYAPDFVINAGGLLNVAEEVEDEGYTPAHPRYKTHHIYDTLQAIYEIADKNRESTHSAAVSLADYRLKYGIGRRVIPPTFHHSAEPLSVGR